MKNKIFIVRQLGNIYRKIDEVKFKDENSLVKYKKHQIPIPPKNPYTLSTKKVNVLFFDLDNKEYITFNKVDLGLNTNFLDKLFGNNMVEQLAKAVKRASQEEKTNWDFIKMAVICGICALGGYLIGSGGI